MKVTINKIAEVANVSRGTVDKVLNNRPGVSDEVRARVKEIIKALDYQPNIVGKVLANQKNKKTIGVIVAPDYNPFVNEIIIGIEKAEEEFKDFGINVEKYVLEKLNSQEELKAIDDMLKKGFSAISMFAIEDDTIRDRIEDIDIPVVTYNSDVDSAKPICFVGQNHTKGGRTAGELLGKVIGGKGKVGIISSSNNLQCHHERINGFKSYIEENYKEIEIVDIKENQDIRHLAFKHAKSMIESNYDLKGLYITGGGIGGLGDALKLLNMQDEIKVVSHDVVDETIKLIEEGIVDFTIGQEPYYQGYMPIKILTDYLVAGIVPKEKKMETKIEIYVKSNI